MKTVAIIQARLTSTRLPRKVLEKIGDKTIIQHVIDGVNQSKFINEVVVATPQEMPFKRAKVFYGDEDDVLARYYHCATKHEADTIVRITADCPLINPGLIDIAIQYYLNTPLSYVIFAPVSGLDVEVFSYRMLEKAHKETEGVYEHLYDREHVTSYMRKISNISVDTEEDLKKVREIYDNSINTRKNKLGEIERKESKIVH